MVNPSRQRQENYFEYWIERNKSSTYSKKLNILFNKAVELIAVYPSIGRPTSFHNVRIKVVRDYLIIYETTLDLVLILTIWDSRRNPSTLEKILKK